MFVAAFLLALLVTSVPAAGAMLEPGEPFPEWTLVDQDGMRFGSSDLAGEIYLLWFYPKADSPG